MYSSTGKMPPYPKLIQNEMSFSKLNTKQRSSKRGKKEQRVCFFILDKIMLTMFGVTLTWIFISYFNAHVRDAPSMALGVQQAHVHPWSVRNL